MRKIFSIPRFSEVTRRHPGEEHDHFLVVRGLEGYRLSSETTLQGKQPEKEIYPPDGGGRVTSTRLPPAVDGEYTWRRSYDLVPLRTTTAGFLGAFLAVASVLGLLSVGGLAWVWSQASTFAILSGLPATAVLVGKVVSAGLVGVSLGLLVSLKAEWTERFKNLLVPVLVVHALLWVGWVSL